MLCFDRHSQQHPKVAASACRCLSNLGYSDTARDAIVAAGGAERVVSVMRHHKAEKDLQTSACGVLSNLAHTNDGYLAHIKATGAVHRAIRIADQGAVKRTILAMETFPDDAEIQVRASWVLRKLAKADENRVKIAKDGGIEALLNAMRKHRSNFEVQIKAVFALQNLAESSFNQAKITAAGGIELILAAMDRPGANYQMHEVSCLALHSLVNGREMAVKRLKRAGAMDRIKRVCDSAPTEELARFSRQLVQVLEATGDETGHGRDKNSLSPERATTKKKTEKGKPKTKSKAKGV